MFSASIYVYTCVLFFSLHVHTSIVSFQSRDSTNSDWIRRQRRCSANDNTKLKSWAATFHIRSMYVCGKNQKPFVLHFRTVHKLAALRCSILTWYRADRDPPGGLPRKRPFHCTSVGLMPAIAPNVGNSGTQFICVGVCVRANPWLITHCQL